MTQLGRRGENFAATHNAVFSDDLAASYGLKIIHIVAVAAKRYRNIGVAHSSAAGYGNAIDIPPPA
jgi:hypothetical protein